MPSTMTDVIDGISTSVAIKAPCVVATTANITLSGEQTIDGVLTSESRVLVKSQTTASQNGIYKSRTSAWTREPDFDGNRDVVEGTLTPVNRGTINAESVWRMTAAGPIVIGTTSLTFEQQPEYIGTRTGGSISETDGASGDVWLWTRQLTGTKAVGAGALNGYSPSAYMFDVYSDNSDAGSDFLLGFRVRHLFGGSALKGGREALSGSAWLTAATHASNANRNYVAVQGKMVAQDDDNGTDTAAGALGAVFGGGFAVYLEAAATNLLSVHGAEFNTFTQAGSSAKYISGISVVGCQATRGATIDAAIQIGAQAASGSYGAHVGWKHGIIFTDENGADPFYASSTLIGSQFQVVKTIAAGIDLAGFTMTSYILRGVYSKLTESQLILGDTAGFAQIDVVGATANANLLMRSRGTGSVYMGGSDGTYSFRADRVASAVNYVATTPAITTGSPTLGAVGTDANIDLLLQGKGTGLVRFGTHTGGGDTVSNGYITIRDAAGNTRKLMTTA